MSCYSHVLVKNILTRRNCVKIKEIKTIKHNLFFSDFTLLQYCMMTRGINGSNLRCFYFLILLPTFREGTIYVLIERIIIVYKSDLHVQILAVNYLEKSLQIDERLLH